VCLPLVNQSRLSGVIYLENNLTSHVFTSGVSLTLIMGIFFWNMEGMIDDANEAFLKILQFDREDVVSGRMRWIDLTPAEWREHDERALAELKATGMVQPYEKEYYRKDGSRVPVLVAGALFEEGGGE